MRTTVDIDDDVLQTAKELAEHRRTTAGKVLSELARTALSRERPRSRTRNGVPLVASRPAAARRPTMKLVNELRDSS